MLRIHAEYSVEPLNGPQNVGAIYTDQYNKTVCKLRYYDRVCRWFALCSGILRSCTHTS